jgi:hypothetical protein
MGMMFNVDAAGAAGMSIQWESGCWMEEERERKELGNL